MVVDALRAVSQRRAAGQFIELIRWVSRGDVTSDEREMIVAGGVNTFHRIYRNED